MVAAVRDGQSQRAVAKQFKVSLAKVQFWVKKAEGKPLEQVIWEDASHAPLKQHNQTPTEIEQRILEIRVFLATKSDLGEFGAVAIRDHLLKQTDLSENELPAISTIKWCVRLL